MATDGELGLLACAGDMQAIAWLLDRHRPSLYAAAISMLGNRADALDAVQDTSLIALGRLGDLRDPTAAKAWLHSVLRNVCLMQLRRRREIPIATVEPTTTVPTPEQVLEEHAARDWVRGALDSLNADERTTVLLRYFTRCTSYEAIARITAVPVGTVRSRLHRARSRLADSLLATAARAPFGRQRVQARQQAQWTDFYRALHDRPVPATYHGLFAAEVEVRDTVGHWHGVLDWAGHEREAIELGVRGTLLAVVASEDVTVLELNFTNPEGSPGHCPRQATFVHQTQHGLSTRLRIHYPEPTRG